MTILPYVPKFELLSTSEIQPMSGNTLDEVITFRNEMFKRSIDLVQKKGADYNRDQQEAGDTLFNLRVAELIGIVDTAERGIAVRLSDKFMRIVSLALTPGRDPMVDDESVLNTVADIHNYIDYLALMYETRRRNDKDVRSDLRQV